MASQASQASRQQAGRGQITFEKVSPVQLFSQMASSMLRSGLGKAKKAREHVDEGLEKVRAKPWAEPLGKALRISGKIAGAVEGLVPGANIIGGALSFGATLLNPEATLEDLQRELKEARISSAKSSNDISKMKDMMSQTFHLVADNRFKVREATVKKLNNFVRKKYHKMVTPPPHPSFMNPYLFLF